jgi:hypothetical protein
MNSLPHLSASRQDLADGVSGSASNDDPAGLAAQCKDAVADFERFVRLHPNPAQPILVDGELFISLRLTLTFALWLQRERQGGGG